MEPLGKTYKEGGTIRETPWRVTEDDRVDPRSRGWNKISTGVEEMLEETQRRTNTLLVVESSRLMVVT